jgi:Domain of unknown function (DUF4124)
MRSAITENSLPLSVQRRSIASRLGFPGAVSCVLLGLMLCSQAQADTMYKCKDADGNQSFSDRPCGKDAALINVKVPGTYTSADSNNIGSNGYSGYVAPADNGGVVETQVVNRTSYRYVAPVRYVEPVRYVHYENRAVGVAPHAASGYSGSTRSSDSSNQYHSSGSAHSASTGK